MERTVELVGFNHYEIGIRQDIVRAVVLGDTAEESVAVEMALVQDVGTHGARCSLAMCSCHTESLMVSCQCSQHLGALLYFETILTEILQLFMILRNSRRIDDQTRILLLTDEGYFFHIFLIVDEHALAFQLTGKGTGRLVVTGYDESLLDEEAGNGTHADASGSYEIDRFDIFNFHLLY